MPESLPSGAKRIFEAAFAGAKKGTCKGDETCAGKVAWSAVKKKYKETKDGWVEKALTVLDPTGPKKAQNDPEVMYIDDGLGFQPCVSCQYFTQDACKLVVDPISPAGHCDLFDEVMTSGNHGVLSASMVITKASLDPVSGERRWAATASDTSLDLYNQRMTMDLFRDFISRIESGEQVPTIFRSDYWSKGLPYLGVSHYTDLDGWGVVGPSTVVYIDGNRLKAKGLFENSQNTQLVDRAFEAIRNDVKSTADNKVRISISFIDWQHAHGDFTFIRRSIGEHCPLCSMGLLPDRYQKGQLIHLALTRVPVNVKTDIEAYEERSMTTKKEDAASIVGKDLAEELDEKSKEDVVVSQAVVVKAETTPTVPTAAPIPVIPPVMVELPVPVDVPEPIVVKSDMDMPYGGALTISDAEKYLEAAAQQSRLYDLWYIFQSVVWNILDSSPEIVPDKAAAVKTAIEDFKANIQVKALVALAALGDQPRFHKGEPTMADHPLDSVLAVLKAKYDEVVANKGLSRNDKLKVLQGPVNDLGILITRSVEAETPVTATDLGETVRLELEKQLGPIIAALSSQSQAVPTPQPVGRQILPASVARAVAEVVAPAVKPPRGKTNIAQIVQKTVYDYAGGTP